MIIRGILYTGGKWYGMEPLNTSRTFEHVFYQLEDMQNIPFQCGVLNGSLHHEMFVKQSVKYEFLSNSTSSREKLLRVNTFLFLSWVQAFSSVCSSSQGSPGALALAWYHCRWVWSGMPLPCWENSLFHGPQTGASTAKEILKQKNSTMGI